MRVAEHAALAAAYEDPLTGARRRDRRDADDRSTPLGEHDRDDRPRAEVDALEVDAGSRDPNSLRAHPNCRSFGADVAHDDLCLSARVVDERGGLLAADLVEIGDHDVRAVAHYAGCDRPAESGTRSVTMTILPSSRMSCHHSAMSLNGKPSDV